MTLGFSEFIDNVPTYFEEKIKAGTKIHSIRKGNRWKAGDKIHMVYGSRTKQRRQFRLDTVVSVQDIIIDFDNGGIWIDGVQEYDLEPLTNKRLAINDGFAHLVYFVRFFKKAGRFEGQIIHWTDKRYK